jgi:hypothetical protein
MQKKSALTAALTGEPAPAAGPGPAAPKPAVPLPDNYAFPCLLHAPDDGSGELGSIQEGLESLGIKGYTVVGSAPTNTLLPNGRPLVSISCTAAVLWSGSRIA